jgi:hypothetical protein
MTEAVYRSNHAFSPVVLKTQEPLFNNTVFRYFLQHDLLSALSGTPIDDVIAVSIVATLGTKGRNYLSCDARNILSNADNVMSISYAPSTQPTANYFFVSWEQGKGSGVSWTPASCNPYVKIDFQKILALN